MIVAPLTRGTEPGLQAFSGARFQFREVPLRLCDFFTPGRITRCYVPATFPGAARCAVDGGSQRRDIAKAKQLVQVGYDCLTFNLRGHARTRHQIETVSRAQNLRDVLAAYDFLFQQCAIAGDGIGLVGSSYGGYLAVLLTAQRNVRWLALRAPALYKDADFDRPKRQLNLDAALPAYRNMRLSPEENRVLTSASRFTGDVLIVESEHDTVIPRQVIENYLHAFAVAARSVTHHVLRRADHGLGQASSRKAYRKILQDWFRKTGGTWAEEAAGGAASLAG